jgi:hypothetical protein
LVLPIILGLVSIFGCTTKSGLSDNNTIIGNRNYERIVYGNKGNPILKIVCEYSGKKPVKGFEADIHWKTIDTDFYKLSFINLTDKRIEFISSKFYQSFFSREVAEARKLKAKKSSVLIENEYDRKENDQKFDPLEYREERTFINWPIHTNNRYPFALTNIIFTIKHMEQKYRFNIFIMYEK